MNIKNKASKLLQELKVLIFEAEIEGLTNEQWFINLEDELNALSCKDHNYDRNFEGKGI